jgi:hypothetical protein
MRSNEMISDARTGHLPICSERRKKGTLEVCKTFDRLGSASRKTIDLTCAIERQKLRNNFALKEVQDSAEVVNNRICDYQ